MPVKTAADSDGKAKLKLHNGSGVYRKASKQLATGSEPKIRSRRKYTAGEVGDEEDAALSNAVSYAAARNVSK